MIIWNKGPHGFMFDSIKQFRHAVSPYHTTGEVGYSLGLWPKEDSRLLQLSNKKNQRISHSVSRRL